MDSDLKLSSLRCPLFRARDPSRWCEPVCLCSHSIPVCVRSSANHQAVRLSWFYESALFLQADCGLARDRSTLGLAWARPAGSFMREWFSTSRSSLDSPLRTSPCQSSYVAASLHSPDPSDGRPTRPATQEASNLLSMSTGPCQENITVAQRASSLEASFSRS
ncbi:hypothetical protein K466DRAFT_19130 [Polyporus arcularius HHB13444]|uniref:Uncharacterized protein n=1 Tax=Polyporus arcularius HHB13444 TaxID=1314778 RepID=A0A5C3PJX2_9APHY|nr:hypothetical protein K466DRAFT_19130 [Polyporus arcularius HHB13444]